MKQQRQNISSNSAYEPVIGFSRAVRVGDTVYVSGTVGYGADGKVVGPNVVYAQAKQPIRNIEAALKEAGAGLEDVVRTRIYVIDIDRWEEEARAHREAFGAVGTGAALGEGG